MTVTPQSLIVETVGEPLQTSRCDLACGSGAGRGGRGSEWLSGRRLNSPVNRSAGANAPVWGRVRLAGQYRRYERC
jgi:hypothetical protein